MSSFPILNDPRGGRWLYLSSAAFADRFPDHTTWELCGNGLMLAESAARAYAQLADMWALPARAELVGFFLRGDAHHQTEFYDITDYVRTCVVEEENPEAQRILTRLRGRSVVRITRERRRYPNWWTEELPESLAQVAASHPGCGILLGSDWIARFRPNLPSYPHVSRTMHTASERRRGQPDDLPWVFDVGAPSIRERSRFVADLAELATRNMARSRELAGAPIAVTLPLSETHRWPVSPLAFASRGIVPAVDVGEMGISELRYPSVSLRLAELATAANADCTLLALPPRRGEPVARLLYGYGFAVLGSGAVAIPDLDDSAGIDADILLVTPREDGWAHAWDEESRDRIRAAGRFLRVLGRRGVSVAVADGANLRAAIEHIAPTLLVLASCRNVGLDLLEALESWSDARHVLVIEPVPFLADGAPSRRLERLLTRRRVRRLDLDEASAAKRLAAALRKGRIRAEVGIFRREDGALPRAVSWQLRTGVDADIMAFCHEEPTAARLLVERAAIRALELWNGDRWAESSYWHANGHTYAEMLAEPESVVLLRWRRVASAPDE